MKPITIDYLRERSDEVGDCWIWKRAAGKAGYPVMSRRSGGDGLVRRAAARLAGLEPAPRQPVVSCCGDKLCVNPAHMRLSTVKLVAKKAAKDGAYSRLPRRVKIAATKRAASKLTMADARAIRASTMRLADLAKKHDVSLGTIKSIRIGRTWKDHASPWAGLGAGNA